MTGDSKIISREWLRVLGLLLALKILMLAVFAYSHHFLPKPAYQGDLWMTRPETTLFQNLANFDGAWFLRIAAIGYQKMTSGDYDLNAETARIKVLDRLGFEDGVERKYAYRHWPLFPWLVQAGAKIQNQDFLAAGVLLANLFYFLYGIFFYKLARLDFSEKNAMFALSLALIHPGAYSLTAVYNEPLFLALAAASLYYLRKDNYFLCGLLCGLASMTRIEAVVLYIPIIYGCLARTTKTPGLLAPLKWQNIRASIVRVMAEPRSLWLLLAPLGSGLVLLYFKLISGNAFIFVQVHEANVYGHFGFPWQMLYATYLKGPDTYLKELPLHALLLGVIVFSFRKLDRTWWVWMAAFWLFYTTNGNHSYLRYQVMAIPMFLGLAAILSEKHGWKYACAAASAAAMAFFGAMYINGYWVA